MNLKKVYAVKKIAWLLLREVKEISKGMDEIGCYFEFYAEDVDLYLQEFKKHEELNRYLHLYASVVNDYKEMKYND